MTLAKTLLLGSLTVAAFIAGTVLIARSFTTPSGYFNEVKKEVQTEVLPVVPVNTAPKSVNKTVVHMTIPREQVILLLNEIDESSLSVASEITTKAKNGKPLFLLINSPGGNVLDGALIVSAMESVNVPVFTVCMQLCASMAAIIHQYGSGRFMVDRSILMFHDAAGGFQGYFPHMKSRMATIDRYVTRFNAHISARSGMSLTDLELNEHTEMWLDGEDSVAKHFADSLVYIDVLVNKSPVDLQSLIKRTVKPKGTVPATPPTFFDVTL